VTDETMTFFRTFNFVWTVERARGLTGGATVQPGLCAPGTTTPRAGILAAYGDAAVGFPAGEAFMRSTPTLDLSLHVFRTPSSPDFTLESRLVKIGRQATTGECWFTAVGEDEPYALCVATFFSVGEPLPEGWSAPHTSDPRFSPHARLHRPIEDEAGIVVRAPGTVELELDDRVSNGTTIQGGIIALLVERACETAVADHVVTGLDLRYLSIVRVGPARAVATPLRSDDRESHFWVEVTDAGDGDRIVVHCMATARHRDRV
jgi:acyl-coenzyme A thioesterase PaaI-like protein